MNKTQEIVKDLLAEKPRTRGMLLEAMNCKTNEKALAVGGAIFDLLKQEVIAERPDGHLYLKEQ